jgi:hypothetical protein
MNQRLLWAVLLGVLFFLGDSVLPEMIGRARTLVAFAAVPMVVGLPLLVRRKVPAPVLRYAPFAAVLWYALLFMDAGKLPDPPLTALVPLAAAGLSIWTALAVQAHAAWKRAGGRS